MTAICDRLKRLAKLFQVPNWDGINEVLLAEWIMETYHSDQLKTILYCLDHPPVGKAWRLTPDTIGEWMTALLERKAEQRETQVHNDKQTEKLLGDITENSPEHIQQWLNQIGNAPEPKRENGLKKNREHLKGSAYIPNPENIILNELRVRYAKENYDPFGKRLDNWKGFDEWMKLQPQ